MASKSTPSSLPESGLRRTHRYITTHDSAGKAVFSTALSEVPPSQATIGGISVSFCYGTNQTPPNFTADGDIAAYDHLITNPPGIIIPNGSVARLVDFPPGYTSPTHRTISLNYNFVVQGEVELILDSGETRRLLPGDMAVQRAVNHAWRNVSSTEWARMTAFAIPATPDENNTPT